MYHRHETDGLEYRELEAAGEVYASGDIVGTMFFSAAAIGSRLLTVLPRAVRYEQDA
jgi:hypothetical protein